MRSIMKYLLFIVLIFIFSTITFGSDGTNTEQKEVEEQYIENISTTNNEVNNISNQDLISIILQMKDDKLILLNNIINWILAGLAVLVTLLIAFFSILFNSIRKKTKEANDLIDTLKVKEEEIKKIQDDVKDIMTSQEYKNKIQFIESSLAEMMKKVQDLDENYMERIVDSLHTGILQESINKMRDFLVEIVIYLETTYNHKIEPKHRQVIEKLKFKNEAYSRNFEDKDYTDELEGELKELFGQSINLYAELRDGSDTKYSGEYMEWIEDRKVIIYDK